MNKKIFQKGYTQSGDAKTETLEGIVEDGSNDPDKHAKDVSPDGNMQSKPIRQKSEQEKLADSYVGVVSEVASLLSNVKSEPFRMKEQKKIFRTKYKWIKRPTITIEYEPSRLSEKRYRFEDESIADLELDLVDKSKVLHKVIDDILKGKSDDEVLSGFDSSSQYNYPYARLGLRHLRPKLEDLRNTVPEAIRPHLSDIFENDNTPARMLEQWVYALSPDKMFISPPDEQKANPEEHYLTLPFNCMAKILGSQGTEWNAKYMRFQYREFSFLSTDLTKIPLDPRDLVFPWRWVTHYYFNVRREPNEYKLFAITHDDVAVYGLYKHIFEKSHNTAPLLLEMAGWMDRYFPGKSDAIKRGIDAAEKKLGFTMPKLAAEDCQRQLRDLHDRKFKPLLLDEVIHGAEALSAKDRDYAEEIHNMINVFDSIAENSKIIVNGPNNGEKGFEKPVHQGLFSHLLHGDDTHPYFYFDGNTYPYTMSELNNGAGVVTFRTTYLAFHLLDESLKFGKHPLEEIVKATSEGNIIPQDEVKSKIAQIQESFKSYYTESIRGIFGEERLYKLLAGSSKSNISVIPPNGIGAVAREARYMLLFGAAFKVLKNLGDGDVQGNFHGAYKKIKNTLRTPFNPMAWGRLAIDALTFDPANAHKLHGDKLMCVQNTESLDAIHVAERIRLGAYRGTNGQRYSKSSEYARINKGLVKSIAKNPGDVFSRFAAGVLEYEIGIRFNDPDKIADSIDKLEDIIGFISQSTKTEREDVDDGDMKLMERELEPAARYYLAQSEFALNHKEKYKEMLIAAYKDYNTKISVEPVESPDIHWATPALTTKVISRGQSIAPMSSQDMHRAIYMMPMDISRRVEYIKHIHKNNNLHAATSESFRLYTEFDALKDDILPQDLAQLYVMDEYWKQKNQNSLRPSPQMIGWFSRFRPDAYEQAIGLSGIYRRSPEEQHKPSEPKKMPLPYKAKTLLSDSPIFSDKEKQGLKQVEDLFGIKGY